MIISRTITIRERACIIMLHTPRIREHHIPNIRTCPRTRSPKLSTAHIRRAHRRLRIQRLAIVKQHIGSCSETRTSSTCCEKGGRVIPNPAILNIQPPIPLMQQILNRNLIALTRTTQRTKNSPREDGGIILHPTTHIPVPATDAVGLDSVTVGVVEGEEVGRGDLVGVVDPACFEGLEAFG